MMKIKLICVGKLKEKYWVEAIKEYRKRLGRFCECEIDEVPDERINDGASEAEEEQIKIKEGKKLLSRISQQDYVIVMDVKGRKLSSEALASEVSRLMVQGRSKLVFVIGGSLGFSKEVLERADVRVSMSDMTFPHQLARVMIIEQIYRAFKINGNETYHK